MTQDELLKKIRFWGGMITVAFVVLVVALVVQFGFIAHNNQEIARLKAENAAKRAELAERAKEQAYENTYWEQILIENGWQPERKA